MRQEQYMRRLLLDLKSIENELIPKTIQDKMMIEAFLKLKIDLYIHFKNWVTTEDGIKIADLVKVEE